MAHLDKNQELSGIKPCPTYSINRMSINREHRIALLGIFLSFVVSVASSQIQCLSGLGCKCQFSSPKEIEALVFARFIFWGYLFVLIGAIVCSEDNDWKETPLIGFLVLCFFSSIPLFVIYLTNKCS
jgi:hypothetical protein